MSKWQSALTLTMAAAMVAATAFAQSSSYGGNPNAPQTPGAKRPDASAPSTSSSEATKPDTSSPSASPSASGADKPATSTEKAPDTSASGSTPSASPGTSTTDATKSDTMKSDKTSKGRGLRMAGGGNRDQVKAIQQALKDKGHDPGAIDGVMGPKTRTALKDFQKKEGMRDTGWLDQETMTKLGVEAKTSGTSPTPGSASPATGSSSTSPSSSPSAGPSGSSSDSSASEKRNSGATEKK